MTRCQIYHGIEDVLLPTDQELDMKFRSVVALSLVFVMVFMLPMVEAGWVWRRVQCNGGYTFQKVLVQEQSTQVTQQVVQQVVQPVVKTETQTTVVNNLIGIPVPVTYNQPIQAQGTTVYGYSSVAEAYGNVDMGLLYNQAARLTDQAQQLAGQASSDFATLVQAEGQNRAEVAKILAQGQSARQALEAAAGPQPQQFQQRSFAFKVTQSSDGQFSVQQLNDGEQSESQQFQLSDAQASAGSVSSLLTNKCAACHNNQNAQGGLNLEQPISSAQQQSILSRVTTDDLTKRMPRNADGTAGDKLTDSELKTLFDAMGGQRQ